MFSRRSLKENGELTERFPTLENGRLIQDLSGIHRLGKLTVNEGFLAVDTILLITVSTWSDAIQLRKTKVK